MEASPAPEHARDALTADLLQQIRVLNDLKTAASAQAVQQTPAPSDLTRVNECLTTTGKLLDQAKTFGEQAAELTLKVTPILTTLAALFGLSL